MESFFGFVSVLPGAFSTFRWKCIKGRPLKEFLKGAKDEFGMMNKLQSCYDANKHLAEDRIMPLEILASEHNWKISYVPGAKCLTDAPLSLLGLLKQRRRWFNGSLFATLHVMSNPAKVACNKCWGKSFWRNTFFLILYTYMIFITILSFVLVGVFYATYSIFLRAVLPSDDDPNIFRVANVLENVYLVFLFLLVILSTSIRLEWAMAAFWVSSLILGVFSIVLVVWGILYAIREDFDFIRIVGFCSYILLIVLPIILNLKHIRICQFLTGSFYIICLAPTYINIISIYAISNIHNITWGSRPDTKDRKTQSKFEQVERKLEIEYKNFRSNFLAFWLIVNICVGNSVTWISRGGFESLIFILAVLLLCILMFKIVFSSLYMFIDWYRSCRISKKKGDYFTKVSVLAF